MLSGFLFAALGPLFAGAPRPGDAGTAPDLQCYWCYRHPVLGIVRCPDQTFPQYAGDLCAGVRRAKEAK
jgi:hypothetical protein